MAYCLYLTGFILLVTVVSSIRLDPDKLVDNFYENFKQAAVELNAVEYQEELFEARQSPNASLSLHAELIYNNWYLFEKIYRMALSKGGLQSNLIDFAVTEARLYSLVRSNYGLDDRFAAKQRDLAIKYKVLSEEEKAVVEKALPNAKELVMTPDSWKLK